MTYAVSAEDLPERSSQIPQGTLKPPSTTFASDISNSGIRNERPHAASSHCTSSTTSAGHPGEKTIKQQSTGPSIPKVLKWIEIICIFCLAFFQLCKGIHWIFSEAPETSAQGYTGSDGSVQACPKPVFISEAAIEERETLNRLFLDEWTEIEKINKAIRGDWKSTRKELKALREELFQDLTRRSAALMEQQRLEEALANMKKQKQDAME